MAKLLLFLQFFSLLIAVICIPINLITKGLSIFTSLPSTGSIIPARKRGFSKRREQGGGAAALEELTQGYPGTAVIHPGASCLVNTFSHEIPAGKGDSGAAAVLGMLLQSFLQRGSRGGGRREKGQVPTRRGLVLLKQRLFVQGWKINQEVQS